MSIVSEAYDILFLFFAHVGSIDLLIDKQELIRNKVLNANGLCGSDIMDVSVRRQFKGKIFDFVSILEPLLEYIIVFIALSDNLEQPHLPFYRYFSSL